MNLKLSQVKVKLPALAASATGRLLFQVSELDIPQGTHLLISGPSGQGKTTLLHLLAGLFLPDEGHVYLGEHSLTRLSDSERSHLRRAHLGIVFQKLNLLEHLTALENVMLGELQNEPKSQERAREALLQVAMLDHADQLSASLSLGEQQRVAVARVLARRPEIVLADEPTSSLDASNAEAVILALLKAAHKKTLIVVSHDERIRSHFKDHRDFRKLVSA